MPKSNVNNCSQLVRIFALSSCAFLLSDRTQFCSRTVRNFALRPYAILLLDRTQFCSRTVRNFALGPYAILLSDRCSYSFLLSNRCSYPRPTGPPYIGHTTDCSHTWKALYAISSHFLTTISITVAAVSYETLLRRQ